MHRVQHTPGTVYTEYSIHGVQHTPSTAYMEYSIHQVQHTLNTAYTEYCIHRVQHPPMIVCLPIILMITSCPLNVRSASTVLPCTIHRHQRALHVNSKVQSPCHIPMVASQLTNKYSLTTWVCWLPPNTRAMSLDHVPKVPIQNHSIMALECTSKFTQSKLPNTFDYGIQVCTIIDSQGHPQTCSIMDFKVARSWPPSAYPNLLNHWLQVYICTHSITALMFTWLCPPKFVSKLTQLWPASAYPISLNHSLQVHICVHSIVIFRCSSICSQALPAASPDILCVDG
jgi:hypothetical protein